MIITFILKDDIVIEEQPKIKLLEQHQFTDTFHPEAFEVTSNVQAPYLTYKVTDLVCKKSFHIDFPSNYFTDENKSCDVNQIYMENNQKYYSLRTPSSINFVTHPHSQISTFKVITGNNKGYQSSVNTIKKNRFHLTHNHYSSPTKGMKLDVIKGDQTNFILTKKDDDQICLFLYS